MVWPTTELSDRAQTRKDHDMAWLMAKPNPPKLTKAEVQWMARQRKKLREAKKANKAAAVPGSLQ